MISLIPIFLVAPGLFAQKAIYNSLYQPCGTKNSSQNGCGPNLICNYQSSYYSQCLANPTLESALYKSCMKDGIICPTATYCKKDSEYWSACAPCRSEYTSCESSESNNYICCPGTTCTSVSAYVNGTVKPVKVCLSPQSLQKRAVNFCYSGCPNSACALGKTQCALLAAKGSGSSEKNSPSSGRSI